MVVSANSRDPRRAPGSTWGRGESLWRAWLCGGMKGAVPWTMGFPCKERFQQPQKSTEREICHLRVFDSFDKGTTMISQKLGAVPLCFKEPQKFLRYWGRERECPVDRLNLLQQGGIKPQRSILHTPFVIQELSPLPVPIPSTGGSQPQQHSLLGLAPQTLAFLLLCESYAHEAFLPQFCSAFLQNAFTHSKWVSIFSTLRHFPFTKLSLILKL